MASRRFTRRSQPVDPDIYKKSVCFSDDSSSLSSSFCDDDSAGVLSPARANNTRHNAPATSQGHRVTHDVEDMAMRQLDSLRSRSKHPPPIQSSYHRSKSPSPLAPSRTAAYTKRDPTLSTPVAPPRRSKTPTFAVPPTPVDRYYGHSPSPSRDQPQSILKRQETESSSVSSETSSTMFQVHHVSRVKTPANRPKTPSTRPKTPTSARSKTPTATRSKTPTQFRPKTPTTTTNDRYGTTSSGGSMGAVEARLSRRSIEPRAEDRMLTNCWTSIRDKSSDRTLARSRSREQLSDPVGHAYNTSTLPRRGASSRNLSPPPDNGFPATPTSPAYSTLPRPFSKPHPRRSSSAFSDQEEDDEVSQLLEPLHTTTSSGGERFYYAELDTAPQKTSSRRQWGDHVTNQYKHQGSNANAKATPPTSKQIPRSATSGFQSQPRVDRFTPDTRSSDARDFDRDDLDGDYPHRHERGHPATPRRDYSSKYRSKSRNDLPYTLDRHDSEERGVYQQLTRSGGVSDESPSQRSSETNRAIINQPPLSPMKQSRYKKNIGKTSTPLSTSSPSQASNATEGIVRVPARPTTPSNLRRTPLHKSMGRLAKNTPTSTTPTSTSNSANAQEPSSNLMRMASLGKSLCDSLSPPQVDHNSNVVQSNHSAYKSPTSAINKSSSLSSHLSSYASPAKSSYTHHNLSSVVGSDLSPPADEGTPNEAEVQMAISEARGLSVRQRVNNDNWVLSNGSQSTTPTHAPSSLVPARNPSPRAPNHPLIDHSRPFSPFTPQQQQRIKGNNTLPLTQDSRLGPTTTTTTTLTTPTTLAAPVSPGKTSIGIPMYGTGAMFGRRKSLGNTLADDPTSGTTQHGPTSHKLGTNSPSTTTTASSAEPQSDAATRTLPRRYARRKTLGATTNGVLDTPTSASATPSSAVQRLLKYTRAKSCERLDDLGK